MTRTHVRIRVHEAVEAAVREAAELAERSGADGETRLQMLIDGWGRGLAAGLEELAVTLEELLRREAQQPSQEEPAPELHVEVEARPKPEPPEPGDEDELRAQAAASRAETEALREEAE